MGRKGTACRELSNGKNLIRSAKAKRKGEIKIKKKIISAIRWGLGER